MADEGNIDAFLQPVAMDGETPIIRGASLDAKFQKTKTHPMEITNFSLESQRDLNSDSASDDELFTFSVTKEVDIATPELFLVFCNCATDQANPLEMARVTLRKAAGKAPLNYL